MTDTRVERRLAAIIAADVVGYSALMEQDEVRTRERLNLLMSEVLEPAFTDYRGRLFKTMGDGFLAEFASVVDAVECAVTIQQQKNTDAPDGLAPLSLRIGINLGDLLIEGEDVHGDGVNVAARIESLAEPGGICISRAARDQVRDKLNYPLEDMGEIEVKNIARPVRVFRVLHEQQIAKPLRQAPGKQRRMAVSAMMLVTVALAGAVFTFAPWQQRFETASSAAMQLPLPDEPSVAVLPFVAASGSEADQQFADAVAEDLTRSLSRVSGLFVIASSSTQTFADNNMSPARIAEDLGVAHIVRGTLQRAGETVRINAELIDVLSGRIIWSDRLERKSEDYFELQDFLVDALATRLSADIGRSQDRQRFTDSPEAFFLWVRADRESWIATSDSFAKANALASEALLLDPGFVRARAVRAFVDTQTGYFGLAPDPEAALERGLRSARDAVAEEPGDWYPRSVLAQALMNTRQYEAAAEEFARAIALEPLHPRLLGRSALPLVFLGRGREAEERLRLAIRINPYHDWLPSQILGQALFLQGRYEEAAVSLENARADNPRFIGNLWWRAATYGQLGEIEKAGQIVETLLQRMPEARISNSFIQITDATASSRFNQGLRAAGLPE